MVKFRLHRGRNYIDRVVMVSWLLVLSHHRIGVSGWGKKTVKLIMDTHSRLISTSINIYS